jgi:hypothetical protein
MIVVKKKMALVFVLVMALAAFGFSASAQAAESATQTVTFQVDAINEISVTGTPSLIISTATAGSEPDFATDDTTTYAITTNESGKKITAAIDENMPQYVTLEVMLDAPIAEEGETGGTSADYKVLSTTSQDVVTGMGPVASSLVKIYYKLSATAAAGVVTSGTKTVTFTIVGTTP